MIRVLQVDNYTRTAVYPQQNKANYCLAYRHQTTTKRSNFWHRNLKDNCVSAYYCLPPHLRNAHTSQNVSDKLHLAINKTVKR